MGSDHKLLLTEDICQLLKSYVYVYLDPRDDSPFYVGKGKGNRVFEHLDAKIDTPKTRKIKELKDKKLEPKIEIIRYGLNDNQAVLVEAAVIDLLGKVNLTNIQSGHHPTSFGKISGRDLLMLSQKEPAKIGHKVMLVSLNQTYRSDLTDQELYVYTRGFGGLALSENRLNS